MKTSIDYTQFQKISKESLVADTSISKDGVQWFPGTVGQKIWMGKLLISANAKSSAQHHGDADTVHYVLDGQVTFNYGDNYETSVTLEKGDFFYLPPYEPYKFKNDSANETTVITTMAPLFSLTNVSENGSVIKKGESGREIKIVRAGDLNDSTKQTANLPRRTAVQTPNLWIGRVSGAPAKDSGAHHHDEAETAGFIVNGVTRIMHGENYEFYEDLTNGDFLRVPPYLPHIERNLSDANTIEFLTARNPENLVVNLN